MKKKRAAEKETSHCGNGANNDIHRERYRVFIEDVADGFYETDLHGNFTYFNDALCRIFGYSRSDIQKSNFRAYMDEENARSTFERFNRIYRTGQRITDLTWEIVRKDGEKRIIELSANLITDDHGEKTGFRGIARDVTEKYTAQQEAIESEQLAQRQYEASHRAEQRYRALLNFLSDPVFVFNLNSTVSYLNPAFEKTFGWTLTELEGKRIPFVPESHRTQTKEGVERLLRDKVLHNFETKRLTRDGRLLDIIVDGAIFYDEDNNPAGQVITLRDITWEKRTARSNQALFRIAKALYQFRGLDARLDFITREVQDLMPAEGSQVILIDPDKQEFFFRAAASDDSEAAKKYKETRFPLDKGVAGEVVRTGKPMLVADYYNSPYSFTRVDEQTGIKTRNMIQVPIWTEDRMIGVLCATNKKEGQFDQADVELLGTIASIVALPIENARIDEELQRSYEEVKSLNRAKDQVIHHLSHEIKTPISVLSASLDLLAKKLTGRQNPGVDRIFDRSRRNLQRLLDMQYEIEDILRERDYRSYYLLSTLLDACADELVVLVVDEGGQEQIVKRIRDRINTLFGPHAAMPEEIELDRFVEETLERIRPRFAHRGCKLITRIEPTDTVWIPPEVLMKIAEGLIRNAIENTPDGSRVEVSVRRGKTGPEFEVKDYGVGITGENQRLIFENYFTVADIMQYSTRNPYDFNAGGRGFDLLRMKIFSERYNFKIRLESGRCRHIPLDEDICPGNADNCSHCSGADDCLETGGTTVVVLFPPASEVMS